MSTRSYDTEQLTIRMGNIQIGDEFDTRLEGRYCVQKVKIVGYVVRLQVYNLLYNYATNLVFDSRDEVVVTRRKEWGR
jgi:hypothetical protein